MAVSEAGSYHQLPHQSALFTLEGWPMWRIWLLAVKANVYYYPVSIISGCSSYQRATRLLIIRAHWWRAQNYSSDSGQDCSLLGELAPPCLIAVRKRSVSWTITIISHTHSTSCGVLVALLLSVCQSWPARTLCILCYSQDRAEETGCFVELVRGWVCGKPEAGQL